MGSSPNDPKSTGATEPPPVHSSRSAIDFYEILHHFSEALAIVQTVSNALQASENDQGCPALGAEISTLRQGVTALRAVHEEFDLAIPGVVK